MFSGSGLSFDLVAQIGIYTLWGSLLLYYLFSAIWKTVRDRPDFHLRQDVLSWVALLVVQLGLTGGIVYLALAACTSRLGL